MSLRGQALQEFDLPVAPQRIDELPSTAPDFEACRVHAPAGRFLLFCGAGALSLAFEATLFDLLVEARYPAPRPRRARGGSFIAVLGGQRAASCYAWPPGEELLPREATVPQAMEVGRLLARLHQLGETHPAAVADPCDAASLLTQSPSGPERETLEAALREPLPPLPSGACHGGLSPGRALFIGDRCSAVLPSGSSGSGALVVDLAETAVSWMAGANRPPAALRALTSGYQALRRLLPEEKDSFFAALRFAAARDGARRLATGRSGELDALRAVDAVGEEEARAAAG
jgi:Ser/Thr protein kinase RdoA (MazF antagonist)